MLLIGKRALTKKKERGLPYFKEMGRNSGKTSKRGSVRRLTHTKNSTRQPTKRTSNHHRRGTPINGTDCGKRWIFEKRNGVKHSEVIISPGSKGNHPSPTRKIRHQQMTTPEEAVPAGGQTELQDQPLIYKSEDFKSC